MPTWAPAPAATSHWVLHGWHMKDNTGTVPYTGADAQARSAACIAASTGLAAPPPMCDTTRR